MQDCDRASLGWQVWLTPRQTRLILEGLQAIAPAEEDKVAHGKLLEWFEREVELKDFRR